MFKRALIVLIVVVAVLIGILYLNRFLRIDDCLDGGGRWDYETSMCDQGR